jgi:hypothetical protein
MARNGFWLWYEIAILWYEMVNYGTKWQCYEMVMVRNDLLRITRNGAAAEIFSTQLQFRTICILHHNHFVP